MEDTYYTSTTVMDKEEEDKLLNDEFEEMQIEELGKSEQQADRNQNHEDKTGLPADNTGQLQPDDETETEDISGELKGKKIIPTDINDKLKYLFVNGIIFCNEDYVDRLMLDIAKFLSDNHMNFSWSEDSIYDDLMLVYDTIMYCRYLSPAHWFYRMTAWDKIMTDYSARNCWLKIIEPNLDIDNIDKMDHRERPQEKLYNTPLNYRTYYDEFYTGKRKYIMLPKPPGNFKHPDDNSPMHMGITQIQSNNPFVQEEQPPVQKIVDNNISDNETENINPNSENLSVFQEIRLIKAEKKGLWEKILALEDRELSLCDGLIVKRGRQGSPTCLLEGNSTSISLLLSPESKLRDHSKDNIFLELRNSYNATSAGEKRKSDRDHAEFSRKSRSCAVTEQQATPSTSRESNIEAKATWTTGCTGNTRNTPDDKTEQTRLDYEQKMRLLERDLACLKKPSDSRGIHLQGLFSGPPSLQVRDKPDVRDDYVKLLANDKKDLIFYPDTISTTYCKMMREEIISIIMDNLDSKVRTLEQLDNILRRIEVSCQIMANRAVESNEFKSLISTTEWIPNKAKKKGITSVTTALKKSSLKFYVKTRILYISRITAYVRRRLNDKSFKQPQDITGDIEKQEIIWGLRNIVLASYWTQYLHKCD